VIPEISKYRQCSVLLGFEVPMKYVFRGMTKNCSTIWGEMKN
jgi:hypothetical protein